MESPSDVGNFADRLERVSCDRKRVNQAILRRREVLEADGPGAFFFFDPKHSSSIANSLALEFGDRIVASVNWSSNKYDDVSEALRTGTLRILAIRSRSFMRTSI